MVLVVLGVVRGVGDGIGMNVLVLVMRPLSVM